MKERVANKPWMNLKYKPANHKIEYNEDFTPINLEEVPDEDLYEDGELDDRQVEDKIINDWYEGRIILMRKRINDKQTG